MSPRARANANGKHEADVDRLFEHGRAVQDALGELASAVEEAAGDAEVALRAGMKRYPVAVLGASFAIGWVLAGGVPARIAALATGVIGRMALGAVASQVARAAAER